MDSVVNAFDCANCPRSRQEQWGCPDLGLSLEHTIGPHKFSHCPGYFAREPLQYPDVSFAVDSRSPFSVAMDWLRPMQNGEVVVRWPAKLRDAVVVLENENAAIMREKTEALKQRPTESAGTKTTRFV